MGRSYSFCCFSILSSHWKGRSSGFRALSAPCDGRGQRRDNRWSMSSGFLPFEMSCKRGELMNNKEINKSYVRLCVGCIRLPHRPHGWIR
jgi:hypothetical protein